MVGKVVKRSRLHLAAPKLPEPAPGSGGGIGTWPGPPQKMAVKDSFCRQSKKTMSVIFNLTKFKSSGTFKTNNQQGGKVLCQGYFNKAGKTIVWVQTLLPSNIFAGVKIDPKTLVKKLDADSRSIVSVIKGEEKKVPLSKKDKMKLRKERWLREIEDIKLAKKLQKAEAKRKATPVVGDMNPLMEALPELSDLVTVSKFSKQPKTQAKKTVTNFSQMKSAQKRRVLEEDIAQFHKTLSDPLFRARPLALIGDHLSKRLKQESEGDPL